MTEQQQEQSAPRTVVRGWRFRLYPTSRQHAALGQMLDDHRELYNAALQERRDAYRHSKTSITAAMQMRQLSAIRSGRPDIARWSFTSQQQTLRTLNKAFAGFFRRVKAGEAPGYPRFRGKGRFDSVTFRNGDGCGWIDSVTVRKNGRQREAKLRIQGIGQVRVRLHRELPPDVAPTQIVLKREGSPGRPRWYAVLTIAVPVEALPRTGKAVGIDLATGTNGLAYLSDGTRIENPRHLHAHADRLARARQELSRKKRGSNRRRHAARRVAVLHRKVRNARLDHHHKLALRLVCEYDAIAHEDLAITNMTKRTKPVPDPDTVGAFLPNGQAAKTGLNKSILDSAWGIFLLLLHAKAESAGRDVVAVNPNGTSITCRECGTRDRASRAGKKFACTACGHTEDADIHAARNVLYRSGMDRAPLTPTG